MPHFVIEYTNCLGGAEEAQSAMELALEGGSTCGFMNREDIKVRLVPCQNILFGDGRTSFIHVTVSLLAGALINKRNRWPSACAKHLLTDSVMSRASASTFET